LNGLLQSFSGKSIQGTKESLKQERIHRSFQEVGVSKSPFYLTIKGFWQTAFATWKNKILSYQWDAIKRILNG